MIVKMTILRLLGSSDDKEKALRSVAPEEPTHKAPVHPMVVGRTDAMTEGNQSQVSLWAPDEPTGQKGASVHWAFYVPETMSSAQEKFLQHRLNRRCIGVLRRCNDVSAQEKILKHRMNR